MPRRLTQLAGPVLVVSPHLDDAVLSCGDLLAAYPNSVVVTVLAGNPGPQERLTPWDQSCGFSAQDNIVAARRDEDAHALGALGASPIWLNHIDRQYRDPESLDLGTMAEDIASCVQSAGARTVVMPLGLLHPDHEDVRAACLSVARQLDDVSWYAYADLPFVVDPLGPDRARAVRTNLFDNFDLHPSRLAMRNPLKKEAVSRYPSQLLGLGKTGVEKALGLESYWKMSAR